SGGPSPEFTGPLTRQCRRGFLGEFSQLFHFANFRFGLKPELLGAAFRPARLVPELPRADAYALVHRHRCLLGQTRSRSTWKSRQARPEKLTPIRSSRLGIDRRHRDLAQGFVGLFLFRERLVEQFDRVLEAKLVSPRLERTVTRDFVVLDRLRRRQQAGIER